MVSEKHVLSVAVLILCASMPAFGKGGGARGGSSASASTSSGPTSGSPVATQPNATFNNPMGIGQAVPTATSSTVTTTTGNQVSTPLSGLGISSSGSSGSSQGAAISTTSSTGNRVGTSSNGLPIGSPGSGQGSPENPY